MRLLLNSVLIGANREEQIMNGFSAIRRIGTHGLGVLMAALVIVSSLAMAQPAEASDWAYYERDMLTSQGPDVVNNYASNVKLQGFVDYWYSKSNTNNRWTKVTAGIIHRRAGVPKCVYGRIWYKYQVKSSTVGTTAGVSGSVGTVWSVGANLSASKSTTTQSVTNAGEWVRACPKSNTSYPRLYFSESRSHPSGLKGVLTAVYVEWAFDTRGGWSVHYDGNQFGGR